MIDTDISKGKLCKAAEISADTMAKMSKDEPVTLKAIERICDVLQCDIGDVVEKIPEHNEYQEGYK